ncbi:nova-1 [Pristionchus pacificus]|uniref:K Homology domain containing protein n=1 Tax=Pristionchus pacificus TaxID=54126 RepID=A0A2A6CRT9_PRIPA|nr:nova-1 [Pristionchus pacificus]|eukprot:PDM80777.1 K Homology domain containing protein [Pristionchus pacificus]
MAEEKFSPDHKTDDAIDESNPLAIIQAAAGTKRAQDNAGGPASKRAHIDGDDSVQVKVLIPTAAVGALIGKGGETMRNLKNESNCRVQMSKNQEVYHGTNERICLVKGKITSAMMVMEAIAEKIREKVDPNAPGDSFDHKGVPRNKEMKLLMPNTSAGMVIGKSGASIKEIREATNCQIQVFPKAGTPEAKTSVERVITVAHDDLQMLMKAVQKVLEKVAADPQHANTHEKDFGGNESFNSRNEGRSYDSGSGGYSNGGAGWSQGGGGGGGGAGSGTGTGGNNFRYNPMQGVGNNELLSFLDSLQATLRTSGFNEASVAEVMQAMQVLAKYNIMGLGLGLGVAAMAQMRQGESGGGGGGNTSSYGGGGADQSFNSINEVRAGPPPSQLQSQSAPPYQSPPNGTPQNGAFYQNQQAPNPQSYNSGSAGYGQVPAQYGSVTGNVQQGGAPFGGQQQGMYPPQNVQYQGQPQQRVYITPR